MGNKMITVVYQDCPLCGDRGRTVKEIVAKKGVRLHKVSFASDEGSHLIRTAVFEKGMERLPFYTDGERFSYDIEDLLKPAKKTAKKAKKTAKKAKRTGVKDNGAVSKS